MKCGHKERSRYLSCQEPRFFQLPESIILLAHNSAVMSFTVKIHSFSQVTFIFDFTRREIFNSTNSKRSSAAMSEEKRLPFTGYSSTRIGKQNAPKIARVEQYSAEHSLKEECSSLRSSERNLQKQSKVPLLSPPGVLIYFKPI